MTRQKRVEEDFHALKINYPRQGKALAAVCSFGATNLLMSSPSIQDNMIHNENVNSLFQNITGAGIAKAASSNSENKPNVVLILANPLFTDRANDDYTLTGSTPGFGCASDESSSGACDGNDRGAWGGSYPIDW